MKKDFNQLPDSSLVWVYQSAKPLSQQEQKNILAIGNDFVESWDSHGTPIPSSIDVFKNQFVVVTADAQGVPLCGGSKDAQMRLMQQLENQLNISLTDRMIVVYKDNDALKTISFNEFKDLAQKGIINKNTTVYNNLVNTKGDFLTKWEVKAEDSWHKQFLN